MPKITATPKHEEIKLFADDKRHLAAAARIGVFLKEYGDDDDQALGDALAQAVVAVKRRFQVE